MWVSFVVVGFLIATSYHHGFYLSITKIIYPNQVDHYSNTTNPKIPDIFYYYITGQSLSLTTSKKTSKSLYKFSTDQILTTDLPITI